MMERMQENKLLRQIMRGRLSRRQMLRRAAALGVSASAMSALLAACAREEATPAASPTVAAPGGVTPAASPTAAPAETPAGTAELGPATFQYEEPQNKGGTLIEGSFADAKTLNPILVSDTASGAVSDLIFNSVIRVDPQTTEPVGDLAEGWEISDDGLVYTFTLRDGVTFHDGEPFTADDVKFTYDLFMNEATGSPRTAEMTERIKTVEVVDERTVRFTLNFPVAPFLVEQMVYGIVPQHVLQDVDPAQLAQDPFSTGQKGRTIGTGPFMFEEWVKDDHITLVKNPNYWEGEPNLDQYIWKVVPDATVVAQQLKTGEIDYGDIEPSQLEDMRLQPNVNIYKYDTFDFTFYAYQLDPEKTTIFQEKEVRQALLYALDRQAMIDAIRFGIGRVAVGTMPVMSWAYNPDAIQNKYEYDPERAKQLLDQAGWTPGPDGIRQKNGQRLAFTIYTNAGNKIREQYVAVFQEQWRQIGVECTPQTEEWNAFLDRITGTKDFEMFLVGFSWGVDPDQSTMWKCSAYEGGFNMNKYCNPEVDQLLDEALRTTDQEQRKELYTQMQNILMEDLPSAILDFPQALSVVNKRVHNLFPNDVDDRYNAHQWWVES
ncbi:peptide-binding protein [Thermomicrobiaceae bacterium CFH 74404]|uniref:Peptide-binding protein n=1 Tax=Thermalbibacter longus TaxID=2951981 RepID=A0AA41WB86_9BACT|nr:peptide-binding protein [Thermalbibacter longus]MCM8749546.1 peptide-binding protein [Thermalbibacter longus]